MGTPTPGINDGQIGCWFVSRPVVRKVSRVSAVFEPECQGIVY